MIDIQEVIKGTLGWCNEKRKEQGKEPLVELPKGRKNDPSTCPCGAATGFWVDVDRYYENLEDFDSMKLPNVVRDFIELFDTGQIPELVLEENSD